ncbi:MAG: hypothetical protein M3O30_00610 [Planctomycetota bacterium]|nr:hypothetical protein [Planctomycetota bacterium]
MPCWVAPMIAAEIWGMSVDQVMAGIADGTIPSRMDGQFLFVWVHAADEALTPPPAFGQPVAQKSEPRAIETAVITPQEREALSDGFEAEEEASGKIDLSSLIDAATPEPPFQGMDISQWRLARCQASRLRQGPRQPVAISA